MFYSVELIRDIESLDPKMRDILSRIMSEIENRYSLSKDVEELKEIVKQISTKVDKWIEISQAQYEKAWQLNLENAERINNIIKAQQEHSKEIAELREIVKQNSKDIAELKEVVKQHSKEIAELREIVKQNSKDIAELKETVKGLIEEHKQTRSKLDKLIEDHEETRAQLGGLSHTVGYFLEDKSYIYLPSLLKRDFGIEVVGELYRDYIEIGKNKYVEVNILGKGLKKDREIYIIGEAKTQAKKKDIDSILEMAKKLEKVFQQEKFLVLVTYQASPQVREYAKEKGVKIYFSFQLK